MNEREWFGKIVASCTFISGGSGAQLSSGNDELKIRPRETGEGDHANNVSMVEGAPLPR
jgi:hypothetical protein